jgi:UDP-N-acetylmuramoyl-L-alanyl-D-glutamate--2,6-diaminopimelate ligase
MQGKPTLQDISTYFELMPQNPAWPLDAQVIQVASDSRQVNPGCVFFAWQGGSFDSHQFIADAVDRGAIAVVGTEKLPGDLSVPYFQVQDARTMLAGFAAYLNDFPSRNLCIIGVTGTDGKTTTTTYIYHILREAGLHAGMISTVNAVIGDHVIDTGFHVTTPEAPQVQEYLAKMVSEGVTHVVLEATSHGLAQNRVAYVDFDFAVVTNITHEHLDYHGSYQEYFLSKAKLFQNLTGIKQKTNPCPSLAVLNCADQSYSALSTITKDVAQLSYGLTPEADLWADALIHDHDQLRFTLHWKEKTYECQTSLLGDYNVLNCLAAIGVSHVGLGIPMKTILRGIKKVKTLVGRMEKIGVGQDFQAIVDFAHTPFALKAALTSARKATSGTLIAVFGSAGLRDRLKRRMMAEVAAELADITVLTAEDPRTESLDGILAEMAQAMQVKGKIEGKDYFVIPDRGQAIRLAVKMARTGDLVIACGKGHEQSMCFGNIEYAWDEGTAMKAALADLLDIEGPEMPYLPTQD